MTLDIFNELLDEPPLNRAAGLGDIEELKRTANRRDGRECPSHNFTMFKPFTKS
jgi:hypothetical protein